MRLTSIRNGFFLLVSLFYLQLYITLIVYLQLYTVFIVFLQLYRMLIASLQLYSILTLYLQLSSVLIVYLQLYSMLTEYSQEVLKKNMMKKHKWHRWEKTQKLQNKDSIVHFILHKNRSLKSHLFLNTFRSVFTYHFHSFVLIQNKMCTNKTVLVFLC